MAGARVADLKTLAAWWLPGIASATLAPTVAEFTASGAINLTCDIEKGSTIPAFTGDLTTTSAGSLCEDTPIDTIIGRTYGGEMTYYRRFTSGAPATDDVTITLPAFAAYGYLVIREGYAFDLAVAAAQKVDAYYVQAGTFQKFGRGTGADVIRGKQAYKQAGSARENVAVLT